MMRRLTRKWRESFGEGEGDDSSLPVRDDSRPIDTREQEELVRSLEKIQAQQSLLWRSVVAGLVLCYVAFLLYSILHQAYAPWELRYHAYFMYEVDSWSIIAADLSAVLVCLMVIAGLLHNSKRSCLWLWYSFVPATLLAIFWLYHMQRLATFRWDIVWLPFGPTCACAICLYVDHLMDESYEEVRKLRRYMYAYKAY